MSRYDHCMRSIGEPQSVCVYHGRYVPCDGEGRHLLTSNPFWVKSVLDFEERYDRTLTWCVPREDEVTL